MSFSLFNPNAVAGSVYELDLVFPFRTQLWHLLTFLWLETFSPLENYTLFRSVDLSRYCIKYVSLFRCRNAENGKSLENEFRNAASSGQRTMIGINEQVKGSHRNEKAGEMEADRAHAQKE